MFQPVSLQALARSLQILSDPRGASDLYVWAARRASAIDAANTVLVVDSAAGMSAVVAHHSSGIGG
jgi:hypothetical protein